MNAASAHKPPKPERTDDITHTSMQKPLIASGAFHLGLFLFAMVGLPFFSSEPELISPPISVEIVEIGEITQTNRPPVMEKKPDEKKKTPEKKEPPPEELEKPEPPKLDKKEIEDPVAVPDPEPKPAPKKEEKKPEPKPKPKPKEDKKPEPKEQNKSFDSLLKDLTPDDDKTDNTVTPEPAPNVPLGEKMTLSERDAIGQQLYPCWNIPAGAKYAENLVVEIRVFMNPDGSIRDSQILDQGKYNRDTHFRAAADAANRALRNPRCTPLRFPPEKYEQLKSFVFRFNPEDML